jgi:hypothetical protein
VLVTCARNPVAGGEPILIDPGVYDVALSEGSRRLYYLSDTVRIPSITGGPSLDLNPTGNALAPLALDGQRVLYRAQDVDGVVELFVSWLERGPVEEQPPSATCRA